ncbi:polyribonucleotide nucleotidyltransferase [Helicobacter cholecystus]|uniref:Polyribonucleotide nucleotidyltransferase n=1 Tax=Helicobacter cholecystus TaxID=45498 RepID=A0A3D8IY38_9HELI|nr:polyribonucleotide nucleotidyltransferase [Helicobacter cholecystus]RDU69534.1 polyribonucleotide nucleotidyltransferase [Helicobacter cholecystus]VEJ24089.1 polynucleotide phosphorylase/polyadenylase [Helicobacter cholecystus]
MQIHNESFDFSKVATQASGSVWYQQGGTVILASVAVDEEKIIDEDFLPLTVQYIEKAYANAKIPSGFIKRESKPSDFETLTSRIIDRTLRPLFPSTYRHPTQISILVLSYDGQSDLQVSALNAASSALYVSSIPLSYPVCAVRVGRDKNGFILSPNAKQLEEGKLDLYISGYGDNILMIEMRTIRQNSDANELSEDELCEAIELAKKQIAQTSKAYEQNFKEYQKPTFTIKHCNDAEAEEIEEIIAQRYWGDLNEAITQMAKSERMVELQKLTQKIASECSLDYEQVFLGVQKSKRKVVREKILKQKSRADHRGLKDVRPISIQTNILPFAHGSCLFKRGQTQALVVATLGGEQDAQTYELLGDKSASKERFMVHYNFPGFSVGEASLIGAPGRRELGHGNLGKRALESNLADKRVVRLVSEILESNGSSSMATVCGGSLALYASGVECDNLVAGVAMGLIKEGEEYAILTDIMGLEDHEGDMDFKVAGSNKGVSALQMDIKLGGVSLDILREALLQAKEARLHILELMQESVKSIVRNDAILPICESFYIEAERIVEIIGAGGKTIKEIIEKFEVNIDLDRSSGEVRVSGIGQERLNQTKDYILALLQKTKPQKIDLSIYPAGMKFKGRVKKLIDFGAFIQMPQGGDGLLHNRKIRAKNISLKEGDEIECIVLFSEVGKVELDFV